VIEFTHKKYTLHFRVFGTGNPVVFLHGFLENHSMWETISHFLSEKNCAVYLIDLPCHGKSRFMGDNCSMKDVAILLNAFFESVNIKKPFVFGHSMGGYIGLELLRLTPIQLTLVHSNFWADSPAKKEDRNRVIEIVRTNKIRLIQDAIPHLFAPKNRAVCEQIIQSLISQATEIPAKEIIACTRGLRDREDLTSLIKDHPIHLIHGDEDPIMPTEVLLKAIEKNRNKVILHRITECGHMSIWENPQALINLIQSIVFR
jgi:pimeloyl-ACP methyl ester carboxylesterase